MDTELFDVNFGIQATFNKTVFEGSIITLDNVGFGGVLQAITYDRGGTIVELPSNDIDFAVIGDVELNGGNYEQYTVPVPKRPDVLTGFGRSSQKNCFTKVWPQYETLTGPVAESSRLKCGFIVWGWRRIRLQQQRALGCEQRPGLRLRSS